MERFVKGDVVVVPFPFSDLSGEKKRPALIIKKIVGNDFLMCQITHKSYEKSEEVELIKSDFTRGVLQYDSFIRVTKIFTADESLVKYKIGFLKDEKMNEIITKICDVLKE
jgi:mRNA interferase MazF